MVKKGKKAFMKAAIIQMDMKFADTDQNFNHAEKLVRQTAQFRPEVYRL